MRIRTILSICLSLFALPLAPARAQLTATAQAFQAAGLPAAALEAGLRAYREALGKNLIGRKRLTVIDYSLPSTQPRLWVLDPERGEVLFAEKVAHGKASGELVGERFGNVPESHLSSLGVFRTAETYRGAHGYSLRLDGLEKGVNDNARPREIVIHAAEYVSDAFSKLHGRLGRSFGCPALSPKVTRAVIDEIRGGSLLVAVAGEGAKGHALEARLVDNQ